MTYKDADWTKIKSLVGQGLGLFYTEDENLYRLYVFVNGEIMYEHDIFKDLWPVATTITREQNDTNATLL
jgi:hypothetical protein